MDAAAQGDDFRHDPYPAMVMNRLEPTSSMPGSSEGLVYVDEHVLALDKPSGLLAVPGRGADKQDCLSARAQRLWPDALVVHRLDMATSGLFLMARGPSMQRILSRAFEQRAVAKRYEAVVSGRLGAPGERGRIDLPLAADWPNRPLQKVDAAHGRPSVTDWEVLQYDAGADRTRVALAPLTGRSHQLRVHLQAIGHPILGDTLYAPADVQARAPRLLLHAAALRLAHPASGEPLVLASAAPF